MADLASVMVQESKRGEGAAFVVIEGPRMTGRTTALRGRLAGTDTIVLSGCDPDFAARLDAAVRTGSAIAVDDANFVFGPHLRRLVGKVPLTITCDSWGAPMFAGTTEVVACGHISRPRRRGMRGWQAQTRFTRCASLWEYGQTYLRRGASRL